MGMRKKDSLRSAADSETVSGSGQGARPERLEGPLMKDNSLELEDEALGRIAFGIRSMPDLEPPKDFTSLVMGAVRSRKIRMPWWHRAYRWARAPRSITLTPLQAAPMAALLLAVCTLSTLYVFKGNHEGILDGRP